MAWRAGYEGDEASGSLVDGSGNGNDIALSGSLSRTAAGGGYTYGGAAASSKGITQSTNATSAGPPVGLVQTAAYTMMAWVKRTTNSPDGWILQGETSASGDRGILFVGSNMQSRCKNSAGSVFTVQVAQPTVGTYYHAATVCDGTTLRLFINGTEVGTPATVTGGLRVTSTGSHLFDTLGTETIIDGVRYYDVAMNAAAITTAMNTAPGAGTTPVTATRATTWNVRAAVTGTRATTWRVGSVVTATRGTTWDVLTPVTGARATTWRVRSSVTSTRATTWTLRAPVTGTRSTAWHVRAAVTSSRSTTWNVASTAQAVTGTRATTWRVLGRVTASRITSWRVDSDLAVPPEVLFYTSIEPNTFKTLVET